MVTAKFSPARKGAFLAALRETGNHTLAAERAKVSRSWVQLHRSGDPAFRRAVAEAVQEARAVIRQAQDERGVGCKPPSGWGFLDGIPVTESCPTCSGTGGAPGATWSTCSECNGRGTISFGQGGFAVNRPCPQCRGRGKVPSQACPTCRGVGDVRTEKRVAITVPPATETGSRIRLRGQGERSRPGGTPGDLIITFQVQPDRFFRRDGLDLVCEVPLNVAQATLGTRLRVRTVDGKKVMLRIPSGTQPGRKFRIKGQGLEKNGRRGDQLVAVQVTVPGELTAEQQDLMKKFAESAGMGF
jgi:molecular chaperone DnaJ